MIIYVVEIDKKNDYNHSRKWKIDLDGGKEFCYRSRVSGNSFFYHSNRNENKNFLYADQHRIMVENAKDEHEYEFVGSLWEFYKIIGFDYKRKKYNE